MSDFDRCYEKVLETLATDSTVLADWQRDLVDLLVDAERSGKRVVLHYPRRCAAGEVFVTVKKELDNGDV